MSRLAPALRSQSPAEVAIRDPEVMVERVRSAAVVDTFEAAAPSMLKAPVVSKVALVPSISMAATEFRIRVPVVMVLMERLPEVAETLLAPVPSIEKAPVESMSYVPVTSMSKFAPAFRSQRPAEVAIRAPEVMVERVRSAAVVETFEAAAPSIEKAPVVSKVALVPSMSMAATEFRIRVPVVIVLIVRLPEVAETLLAPVPSIEKTPVDSMS